MKFEIDRVKSGQKIKKLMKERQLTPQDLRRQMNLTCVQTVYRWTDGVNIPTLENFYALSRIFQVPMDELIIGKPDDYEEIQMDQQKERGKKYCERIRKSAKSENS